SDPLGSQDIFHPQKVGRSERKPSFSTPTTNVSTGQSRWRRLSRPTNLPHCSKRATRIWKGLCCRRTLRPFLLISPVSRETSNGPNRYPRKFWNWRVIELHAPLTASREYHYLPIS